MQKLIVSEIVNRLISSVTSCASSTEQGSPAVSLDAVAEAIGDAAVTLQDIEAIFDGLDAAGQRVEAERRDPPAALARVLATVRSFSAVSGRRPTLAEISEHSGLTSGEVRFALIYARVLVR